MQLSAESLTCVRGGRTVFSGLSFSVSSGEALTVVGRNGAGKSSLLRVIAGLVHLAAGMLSLSGAEAEASVAEQAHYLGHQDALKGSLSVRVWGDGRRFNCIDRVVEIRGRAPA